jgi:glycosyltransferase involved in cell wall biosynthesis
MDERPTTAIVIPAFNEEESLPVVLKTLADRVPECDVVVVDDGSADQTYQVASAAGVVVLRLPFNLGIGGALRAGFRYAVEHGYDRVVQFDADGQHDAEQIERLLAGLDEGADMVIGSRFAGEGDYKVGIARGSAMGALRLATRALTGQKFSDTSSGFRAIGRPLLEDFARDYPVEYMDSVETLVTACRDGYDVRCQAISIRYRDQAS